jgi:uncharacterized membrane protein YccC
MRSIRPLVARYRQHGAVRRAARTAVVMPAMFAIGEKVIGNPSVATFAAFGAFAMTLLVEFSGPMRDRLQAQLALSVVGLAFVTIGTMVSRYAWLAVLTMALIGFVVIFAGVVSSVLASATTSLLLAFILPVSLPGTAADVSDRVAGWGLASGAALLAIALLWPSPTQEPLRAAAADACRALAARLRADQAYHRAMRSAGADLAGADLAAAAAEHEAAVQRATEAVAALHRVFLTTPFRPTGLSTSARATVRLVDEISWMSAMVAQSPVTGSAGPLEASMVVKRAVAEVLDRGADQLGSSSLPADALTHALVALRDSLTALERDATIDLPVARSRTDDTGSDAEIAEFLTSLDPSFRAQELSFAVALVARNIERAAAADRRSWWEQLLGHQPEGLRGPFGAAQERAAAHLERHSVWLHNSVRGAAGLALAVLVATQSGVQHSFWVVLGTLSVLRSNALNTGQNALRGVLGTVVGFVIGAALLALIGTNTTVLWLLLPVVVLLAGIAPVLISFVAGQAAFTLTVVILFNIVQPAGWRLGLVRVEDVAIGCAVSVGVGLLFWPRGAASALRKALAEAYADSAAYLDQAVRFGALRCDHTNVRPPVPVAEAQRAAAGSRRLDDTFRNYLAERGAKPVPLAEMTSLVTGVAGLRLAADAIVDLWQHDDDIAPGDREAARAELLATSAQVRQWYYELASSLDAAAAAPPPLGHDTGADARLIDAVRHDLRGDDGTATSTAVRVIWTADHLDAARRLQATVSGTAAAV